MIARHWRRLPVVFIGILLSIGATVAFAVSAPGQHSLAPAGLRVAHAKLNLKCSDCHVPSQGVPSENCAACHKREAKQTALGHGRHAGMIGACVNCHAMHDVPYQSDQHIDRDSVDHARMRFTLKNHEGETCASCHGNRFDRFSAAAGRRCKSCHIREKIPFTSWLSWWGQSFAWASSPLSSSVRHARDADLNCLKCHRGGKRATYKHEGHQSFFVGKHLSAGCNKCHKNQTYTRVSGKCEYCHKAEHGRRYAKGCSRCHSLNAWKPAKPLHAGKLDGKHLKLRCRDCHPKARFTGLDWTCATCHKTPHTQGTKPDCRACHDQTSWKPAHYKHVNSLDGAHPKLACAKCHKDRDFEPLGTACDTCHGFRHYNRDCVACHNTSRWTPTKMNHGAVSGDCASCHDRPARHYGGQCSLCHSTAKWKGAKAGHAIQLSGVHPNLACAACHAGGRYSGLSWTCGSCHGSPHGAGYGSNCSACHGQSNWGARLNHAAVAGDCSACHNPPGNHAGGSCGRCHSTSGGWSSNFSHPGIKKHSSTSFPCNYCHPSGYDGYSCTRCHSSNSPDD